MVAVGGIRVKIVPGHLREIYIHLTIMSLKRLKWFFSRYSYMEEGTIRVRLHQASAPTLRWRQRYMSHWKEWSCSRMGCNPILERLYSFHWFQWEPYHQCYRSVDSAFTLMPGLNKPTLELFFSPGPGTWRRTHLLELFVLQVLVHGAVHLLKLFFLLVLVHGAVHLLELFFLQVLVHGAVHLLELFFL